MKTFILDGYNVIHAMPELARQLDRGLRTAREALVRWCQEYRGRRGDVGRLYVVFDGRDLEMAGSHEQQHGHVTVLFSQKPEEADARILRVIEAQGSRSRCVVVSNDNEVSNNARAFGARVLSVQEFSKQVRPMDAPQARSSMSAPKVVLPLSDAKRITEEYRTHLEHNAKGIRRKK